MTALIVLTSVSCLAIWTWVLGDIFDWQKRLESWLWNRRNL